MRNLTIKRNKAFSGSMVKLKVYLESPLHTELVIAGTPCRKLGELKNGQEQTFTIDDTAARVFVIADPLSKDYCFDSWAIPAGTDDVSLSGRCQLNLSNGNAFVFDGAASEEVLQQRKKNKRKGGVVLAIAIVIGLIVGLLPTILDTVAASQAKTFSQDGFEITLNGAFKEIKEDGFIVCYESKKSAVMVSCESFADLEGMAANTEEDYARLVMAAAESDETDPRKTDGLVHFTYRWTDSDGTTYVYMPVIFKGDDAFWMVQFVTTQEYFDSLRPEFLEYAKTVKLP